MTDKNENLRRLALGAQSRGRDPLGERVDVLTRLEGYAREALRVGLPGPESESVAGTRHYFVPLLGARCAPEA